MTQCPQICLKHFWSHFYFLPCPLLGVTSALRLLTIVWSGFSFHTGKAAVKSPCSQRKQVSETLALNVWIRHLRRWGELLVKGWVWECVWWVLCPQRVCAIRGKGIPSGRVRVLKTRRLRGPGRAAPPLQVIDEEVELIQLEPSWRWGVELCRKDFFESVD